MSFSLEAIFGVDTTGVRASIKSLRRDLNDFVNDYAKLGAGVGIAAFVALSKGAVDLAGKLSDTAANIGVNVESLQALEAQHKRNGVSSDDLTKALQKTKAAVIAAAEGDEKASAALAKLHLNGQALIRLPLDKQYEAIAKAAAGAKDQNEAYAAVSALLGEKVGPKLMGSLRELAEIGLPGVVKGAREAGQVMSAETIVALDRAGDAIDDFKKSATIAVGDIIVNFRTEEGLKLLGFKLLKIAGEFGGSILDFFTEAGGMAYAVLKGSFTGVLNFLQDGFVDVLKVVAEQINILLPKKFEIDVTGLDALKSTGRSIGEEITAAIAQTSPSTFKKDFGESWSKAIGEQQKIVDGLNRVDLGPEADKLRAAGSDAGAAINAAAGELRRKVDGALTDFFGGMDKASKGVTDAGKSTGQAITEGAVAVEAAGASAGQSLREAGQAIVQASMQALIAAGGGHIIGSAVRGGGTFNTASDESLQELARRNRQKAVELRNDNPMNYYNIRLEAGRLEQEAQNAENELRLRSGIRSAFQRGGTGGVFQAFPDRDPVILQNLVDQFAKQLEPTERTSKAIEKIAVGLQERGIIPRTS